MRLEIAIADGTVRAELSNGWDSMPVNAQTAVAEYHQRYARLRDRNPDMTDDELCTHALQQWWRVLLEQRRD